MICFSSTAVSRILNLNKCQPYTHIIQSKEHIDLEIKKLTEKIMQDILKNTTFFFPLNSNKDLLSYIQIQAAINYKWRLRSHWQPTRDPANKPVLNRQTQVVRDLRHSFMEDK